MRHHLGQIVTSIPGPRSLELGRRLSSVECPDTTYLSTDFPVFWERAEGANVWDVDGNCFVDLTGAFGVSSLGHGNPMILEALQQQSRSLVHGMGDVHPTEAKVQLAERLARVAPGDLSVSLFGLSGSDAIEAALKTAVMYTGKTGVMAFRGGYHGLGFGALSLTWRHDFRAPFEDMLNPTVRHLDFPLDAAQARQVLVQVEECLRTRPDFAAIVVEPIQGRGGIHVAPEGFLRRLKRLTREHGVVLIFDEIFTGLGRTGKWFACEHDEVTPDLLCVGKSLGGGLPISACIGTAEVMQAWGRSQGEARHTSTFLGHPLACATALATLRLLEEQEWPQRVLQMGRAWEQRFRQFDDSLGVRVRGRGAMWGLEMRDDAGQADAKASADAMLACLRRGLLLLAGGTEKNVLQWTPPFVINDEQQDFAFATLGAILRSRHSISKKAVHRADPSDAETRHLRARVRSFLEDAPAGMLQPAETQAAAYGLSAVSFERLESRLATLVREVFDYQYQRVAIYRDYCRSLGVSPSRTLPMAEIPPIPVEAFRCGDLSSFAAKDRLWTFRTSGTTGAGFGELHLRDTLLYDTSLSRAFRHHVVPDVSRMTMLSIVPPLSLQPHSSLGYMLEHVVEAFGDRESRIFHDDSGLQDVALQRACEAAVRDERPVCLLGTTLGWMAFFESCCDWSVRLPEGSRLLDTGGMKGRRREVSRQKFLSEVQVRFGVPASHVVREYGMTELGSQYYSLSLRQALVESESTAACDTHTAAWSSPFWLRPWIIDSDTRRVSPAFAAGDVGLLSHLDLANLETPIHVLTADLGRSTEYSFALLGRCAEAEPRGCGLAFESVTSP